MKIEIKKNDYYVDGKKKDRVTNVLKVTKQCDDYSGVDTYYRDIGIATALAIQYDLAGTLDEDSVDPDVKPRLSAWRKFCTDHKYKACENELSLYSKKYDICGTLDHYGELDGKLGIIDTKCTKTPKKWWKKQLHFYKQLVEENRIGPVAWLAALMLKDDATYELVPFRTKPKQLIDWVMGLYWDALDEDKRRNRG